MQMATKNPEIKEEERKYVGAKWRENRAQIDSSNSVKNESTISKSKKTTQDASPSNGERKAPSKEQFQEKHVTGCATVNLSAAVLSALFLALGAGIEEKLISDRLKRPIRMRMIRSKS
ncbi:Uncharacterized protein Fot_20326 [Forsythia ovata]|uniref:Uncharacterized protein n=1 Tax=Forsythia ovata TaxID=205694 RepID=A0ABD1VNK2_9LAMI